MYANAALIRPSFAPDHNSAALCHTRSTFGGPAGRKLDFAPDIYFELKNWSAQYDRRDNPLFIPEAASGPESATNVFYGIGQHKSFAFSPFGIDAMDNSRR